MNKSFNYINFTEILNRFQYCFPLKNIKIKKAFKYNKTLGRMIYNYKDIKSILEPDYCNCQNNSYFIDKHHGHIITGDLDIDEDKLLGDIMSKGTKHRLIISNSNFKIKNSI